jgi:RHS repeat-associated protein
MRGIHRTIAGRFVSCLLSLTLVTGTVIAEIGVAVATEPEAPITESTETPISVESSPTVVEEDISRRTAESKTYLMSDGSYRAEIFERPIHFEDDAGEWTEIDPTLVPTLEPGEYGTEAVAVPVTFGEQNGVEPPVRLETDEWSIGIDMLGAAEDVKLTYGNRARYLGVAPATDLEYEATDSGIKETLVLSSEEAPSTYHFFVTLDGLEIRQAFDGTQVLCDPEGRITGELGELIVFDSSSDDAGSPAYCQDAQMSINPVDGGAYVTYDVPRSWLSDPERVWPVMVDPTVTIYDIDQRPCDDTFIAQDDPNSSFWSLQELQVGSRQGYSGYQRVSLVKFNLDLLPADAYVTNANFKIYQSSWSSTNGGTGSGSLAIQRCTSSWTNSATWNNSSISYTSLGTQSSTASGAWLTQGCTATVQYWRQGGWPNYGLRLAQTSSPNYTFRKFISGEYGTTSYRPRLVIDYADPTPYTSVQGYSSSYKCGDTVTVTMKVNTAYYANTKRMELRVNKSGGSARYRGYLGWFVNDAAVPSGWTVRRTLSDGSKLAEYTSGAGNEYINVRWSECIAGHSASAGYKYVTFKYDIKDTYGDVQDNDFETGFRMDAGGADYVGAWTNHDTNFDVLPAAQASAPAATLAPSGWFREVDRDADNKADTPNDLAGQGRGDVALSWSPSALANGYRVYMYDGGAYRKVGETIGNAATTWTSAGTGIFPLDSEYVSRADDSWTGNPYCRAQSPSTANLQATVNGPGGAQTGLVVTDGTYLYIHGWDSGGQWRKIGSGVANTTAGEDLGKIGPDFAGQSIRSAFYLDGFIYNGRVTGSNSIEGVWVGASKDAPATKELTFNGSQLYSRTDWHQAASGDNVMLAADTERIYSICDNSGTGFGSFKVREFDRDGTFIADHSVPDTKSYTVKGVMADGNNLYLVEDGSSNRITKVSTSTWRVVDQWGSGLTGNDMPSCYDPANNVFWAGSKTEAKVRRYAGPGLGLKDNPNALYTKTPGDTYDDRTNYWFRIVPYNSGGELSVTLNPCATPTLDNRTVRVNDDPRHTTHDLGEFAHHGASATLDEGTLELDVTDLAIASWGPQGALTRHYSSESTAAALWAEGWRFGFERSLAVDGTTAIYTDEAAEEHAFTYTAGSGWLAPNGMVATLAQETGGYSLTFKDRSVLHFDEGGVLISETDRNGNEVAYEWVTQPGHLMIRAANAQTIDVVFSAGKVASATYATGDGERTVEYALGSDTASDTVTYYPGTDDEYAVEYSFDAAGHLKALAVPDFEQAAEFGDTWQFLYDTGRLTQVRTPGYEADDFARTDVAYQTGGATVTRYGQVEGTEHTAIVQSYQWNPTGTLAEMTDPKAGTGADATWSYTYSPTNEPVFELSPTGKSVSRVLDIRDNTVTEFDEEGHRTTYRYDEFDQVIRQIDPRGCSTYFEYDEDGNLKSEEKVLDATGMRSNVDYAYDTKGLTIREERSLNATETAVTTYTDFAENGEPQQTTQLGVRLSADPNAQPVDITTMKDLDAFGNLISETDALGVTTVENDYSDETALRLVMSTDASGTITHHAYDRLGNEIESYRSAGGIRADWSGSVYDVEGRQCSSWSRLATGEIRGETTHVFDTAGRETGSDDLWAPGTAAVTHLDARGNVIRQWAEGTDPGNTVAASRSYYDEYGQMTRSYASGETSPTLYTYAPDGLLNRQDNPDGSYVVNAYDAGGNKVSETDQDGAKTTYAFDVAGRAVSSTSADGVTTTHVFDLADREIATTGGGSETASANVYNTLGWVLRAVDSDGIATTKTYDKAGRVLADTVHDKTTVTEYDALGRTVVTTDPDGKRLENAYDAFGRVVDERHTTDAGVVKHTVATYDALGRPATTTDARTGVVRSFAYATSPGQETSVTIAYGDVSTTVVTSASGEELSRTSASAGAGTLARTVTTRDAARRETGYVIGTLGFARTFRPEDGKLSSIGVGEDSISFGYDTSGRKSSESGSLDLAPTIDAAYDYTETGRLRTDTATGASVTYAFDAAGNITTETVGAQTRLYSYDAANRLASVTEGGQTTRVFGWDASHGQRTSEGSPENPTERVYAYTGTGRLQSLDTSSGLQARYEYDASGQRTHATVTSGTVSTDTSYVYEGLALLSLATTVTAGTGETTASVTYLYDGAGSAYAGIYRSADATPVTFTIVANDRGDVLELRDEAGAAFAAYAYDSWGVVRTTTTQATELIDAATAGTIAHAQPLRYAGYVYDEVEGLYYLSARTYDPATRQFLTKDPAKADGEESAYQYCGGDPVGSVDPSGEVYTRWKAVNYARRWANSYNPLFPKFLGGDCTNFVSQCLHVGGIGMDFWGGSQWWLKRSSTHHGYKYSWSTSWTVARDLYRYLIDSGRGVHKQVYSPRTDDPYPAPPNRTTLAVTGDVIFYDWTGDYRIDHAAIVSSQNNKSAEGYNGTIVCHHTSPRKDVIWHRRGAVTTWDKMRLYVVHVL